MNENDFVDDSLQAALARGEALRRHILAPPEMLSEAEFRRRIKEAYTDRLPETLRVLVLPSESGELRFPAWQIGLSGFGRVLAVLEDVDAWMQFRFFTEPDPFLRGRTPIAALKDGDVTNTVNAARRFAEREQGGN